MKFFSILTLLSLVSFQAFSMVELTDDELRDVEGRVLPSGLSVELEKQVMKKIAENIENAVELERLALELERSLDGVTESNVEAVMRRFYLGLGGIGIGAHILERQMEYNLYLQQQALLEAQNLEMQRALFRSLVDGLRSSLLEYRSTGDMGKLLININTNFTLKVINISL